jgi:hypothetical protein
MIRPSRMRPRTPQHCTAVPEAFLYPGLSVVSRRGDCGSEGVCMVALERMIEIARRHLARLWQRDIRVRRQEAHHAGRWPPTGCAGHPRVDIIFVVDSACPCATFGQWCCAGVALILT